MIITNRRTGATLYDAPDATTMRQAVIGALAIDADLTGADLTGADLTGADLTGAGLTGADLTGADLTGADLRGADLRGAGLRGAGLRGAGLTGADLTGADLRSADLTGADLTGADLRGAEIPIIPNIDSAVLAAIEAGGTLRMDTWHTCNTTHCRAGWAIVLAGDAGAKLETNIGSAAAGALIYAVSRPNKPVPDFYASNKDAMADIRASAQEEAHSDA